MYDSADTGRLGGIKKCFRVLDGIIEGNMSIIKAQPVGVVKGRSAPQAVRELRGVVEIERDSAYPLTKGVLAVRVPGKRSNLSSYREEALGDVLARVPEGPCDYIQLRSFDSPSSSNYSR